MIHENDNVGLGIIYKSYIPPEWFNDIEYKLKVNNIGVEKEKENPYINNFTGPELADILIYIKDSPESIILAPAVYDVIKFSVLALWNKLKPLVINRISSDKIEPKPGRKISIRYKDGQNKEIDINIEDNFEENNSESIILKALEFLEKDKKESIFEQKNLVDNSGTNPRIEIDYNPISKNWEPIDFEKKQKELDELLANTIKGLKS